MDPTLSLRPITPADEPFLYRVYASTRVEELAVVPWSEPEKAAFLAMQFHAQHRHYQQHYPKATFSLILRAGEPIGRLYVDRRADTIRIVDIALLPEHRRQGIGGHFLHALIAEAEAAGKPLSIHVERLNPALRLYRRLGFQAVNEEGVYLLMERPCSERRADAGHASA